MSAWRKHANLEPQTWQQSADARFKEPMNRLCSYVSRYIIPVVRDRVISENAELAGFPQFSNVLYTQNVLECGNAMLKNWTGFKEKDVDSFILDFKEMVMREEDDVARALAGLESPYEVLEEFCPFVSKFADHLINPDLCEQERKRTNAKTRNANVSDVSSKVDEFQPLGMYNARASVKGNNVEGKHVLQFDCFVGLGFSEPMINSIKTKAHKLVLDESRSRASVYLWHESCHPFLIPRKQKRRVRKFPGCCKEFDERPPQMDIIVVHQEKDWRAGTDKVTAVDNPQGYHLDLLSIRVRHPEFLNNPETLNLVIDFAPNKDEEVLILDKLELDMLPVIENVI